MTLPGGSVGGPVFAVGVASGIGTALAAILAQAFADGISAGAGASSGDMFAQASSTAVTAGLGTALATGINTASSTAVAAGLGTALGVSISISFSTALASGSGDVSAEGITMSFSTAVAAGLGTPEGILTAQVFSAGVASGAGTADGKDSPASVAEAAGTSLALGVAYAFYADAEMAAPAEEIRVVYVPWEERNPVTHVAMVPADPRTTYAPRENTVAVVPPESRVYEVQRKPRVPYPPNRRRKP